MSTIIEDLRFLADERARYLSAPALRGYYGEKMSYWSLTPTDQAVFSEANAARQLAAIIDGSSEGWGWMHSFHYESWEARAAERNARRAEAEALRAEVESAVADYVRLYRVPYALPPNLTLAVNALALLHAETGL